MHYYLPAPYPDELIGSLLLRTGRHLGLSVKQLHLQFGASGKSSWPLLFHSSMDVLAAAYNISPKELLFDHSLFPYATAFLSRIKTEELALRYFHISHPRSSALVQSATVGGAIVRYCEECVRDDLKEFGEDYWHRHHNLPWVSSCHRHGIKLKSFRPSGGGITIQSLPHESSGTTVSAIFSDSIQAKINALSIAALDTLNRKSPSEWQQSYRSIAMDRNFPREGKDLSSSAIVSSFVEYFGRDSLVRAGLPVNTPWPALLLRRAETSCIPGKHILMQAYLANGPLPLMVSKRSPGRKPRDFQATDQRFAALINKYVRRLRSGTKLSVPELLDHLGIFQTVRHNRGKLSQTLRAIEEFRRSEFSVRKSHRVPISGEEKAPNDRSCPALDQRGG